MKAIIILPFLLFIAGYSKGQEIKSATITDFGLLEPKNPDMLIKQTDSIPMIIGNSFGFHFKIIASPDNKSIPLTMKIQITDTKGVVHDMQYNMNYLPHDMSTGRHSFLFETQEELIPGVWKFSIDFGGKEILMKNLLIVE